MVCAVYRVSTKCVDVRCQRRAIYDKLSPRSSNHGSKSSNGPAVTSHASFVATVRYDCYERVIRRLHRSCIMLRTDGFASIAFNRLWTDKKKTSKKTGRRGIIMIVVVVINTVSISNAQFKCGSNSFQSNLQRDIQFFFGNGRCSVDHTIYVGWSAWLADCRIVNPDLRSSLRIIFFLLLDCFRLERKSAFYPKKLLFMKLSGLIILWIINIWCRSKYSCSSDCSEQANFSGKSQRMNTYRSTNDPSLCAVGYKQWLFTWNLITTYLYIYREWYENISCECTEPPRGAYERNYKCGVWFWDSAFWADRCARYHLNDATQNTSRIEWAKCRIIITYIACVFVVIPHSALAYAMHDS